jgi:photosystem II stability/assembly factor-like uncharacterized protein
MKTKLLFLATFITIVSSLKVTATRYEWEYINSLQNEWLQKICTQGLDTVYVVGRNGLIAQSTDRASTWHKQYPVNAQLNDVVFCNHTTGFAIGNGGVILKTTDAGANWTQQNSGITENLNAIAFTGTDNIWVVGDGGKAIFSTDAGTIWQIKDFSTSVKLNDISFRNNVGYIVGNAHTCFYTTDKGSSWKTKDITLSNPYQTALISVNQTMNHTCILIGDNDFGTFGLYINVDNNIFVQPNYHATSFTMKNDSIGYSTWSDCLAGSIGGCSISVQEFNLKNIEPYAAKFLGVNTFSVFDINHSDMNFVNDSIGYFATGFSFFQLKKYIPEVIQGVIERKKTELSIQTDINSLIIQLKDERIDKIELYNPAGLKIYSEIIYPNEMLKTIDIAELAKGMYIIRAYYKDNIVANNKWLK